MLNEDCRDMLRAFSDEGVECLRIGGFALGAHGYPRATQDIDLWARPRAANADAVLRALKRFGAPLHGLTTDDLQRQDTIFQIGVAPRRIDIVTGAAGLEFEQASRASVDADIGGIRVRVPSIDDLICNKRAAGRTRDLADAEALEALKAEEDSGWDEPR